MSIEDIKSGIQGCIDNIQPELDAMWDRELDRRSVNAYVTTIGAELDLIHELVKLLTPQTTTDETK